MKKNIIPISSDDLENGITPELGFSIKTLLGGDSTLINSSGATNFCYRIDGVKLSKNQIAEINSISTKSKIKDRVAKIKQLGGNLI